MVPKTPFKEKCYSVINKKLLPWTLYALLPAIVFIHIYLYPTSLSISLSQKLPSNNSIIINPSSFHHSPPSHGNRSSTSVEIHACDYTEGKWVHDKWGPLYNGTSCSTIKDGQNCLSHGRPDQAYLHWRWKPKQCKLPRFDPKIFLQLLRNKHLAFVGDSMARNQLESLICMIATATKPNLVYTDGEENRFRKLHFASHNATVSLYWSPFLVNGVEKKGDAKYNELYLDTVNERWAGEMSEMDMIVLSVGHWFLHPAVYYHGGKILGCHYCHHDQNYTEIEFFDVFGKAINTTLNTILERKASTGNKFDVFLTTFSPHHFEGEWDKFGACPKTQPYKENEKQLQGMDTDMRRVEIEEVNTAKEKIKHEQLVNLRLEALDVTKLAWLRPDGHPGPYMYAFPFADGIRERVQNDCVHWCLPGPIDTWNEILLDVLKLWHGLSSREREI